MCLQSSLAWSRTDSRGLIDIDGVFHNGFITDREFTFEQGFPIETGLAHPSQLIRHQEQLFELAEMAQHFARSERETGYGIYLGGPNLSLL